MTEIREPKRKGERFELEIKIPELDERILHEFGDEDEAWKQYRILRGLYKARTIPAS